MLPHVAERYTELDGHQFMVPLYVQLLEAEREAAVIAREAAQEAQDDAEWKETMRRQAAALLALDGMDCPGERLRGARAI